ncbi:glycosyltransferase family 39 protein [soil metagenome]
MIGSGLADRFALPGIVLLGVLVRLAILLPVFAEAPADPDNYLPMAAALAEGRGLQFNDRRTAYRPPLYPLLLAPGMALGSLDRAKVWVFGLHLTLGAATISATGLAARRWGMPRLSVLLASAIVAFDPVLVIQGRSVMTETLAAALVAGTLATLGPDWSWRKIVLGGIGLGLCALCRPSLLPAAPLLALALFLDRSGLRPMARLGRASVLLLTTWAVLLPWAIRNSIVFGEPVWTTTHGGYTLALANNPVYYEEVLDGPPGAVWTGPNQRTWFQEVNQAAAGLSEPEADRLFRQMGRKMLRERPRDFARASIARLGRFWGIAPAKGAYPNPVRWATAAWTVPLWVLLGIGLIRPGAWRWPRIAAIGFLLALTAVHTVYWTDMRMRAPIVPAIALIASGALRRTVGERHGAAESS